MKAHSAVLAAILGAGWLACSSEQGANGLLPDLPTVSHAAGEQDAASASDKGSSAAGDAAPPVVDPDAADAGAVDEDAEAAPSGGGITCTSGTYWTQGNTKSALMHPGAACRDCHVVGGLGLFSLDIGGTVYPTAHEPIDCNGVGTPGVTMVVTDANGKDTSFDVNAAGNFWHSDLLGVAPIAKPFNVKIVSGTRVRAMVGALTDGDCNKCHSVTGTNLAPGRILLP
jgi:hypothetical protein